MSTDYYVVCKKHNIGAHITNNKADKPFSRTALREFLNGHSGCSPVLEDEHTFDLSLCIEDDIEKSEIKTIKQWANRLRYRFIIWKSDRALIRQKKAIGRALLPAMKDLLEQIESKDK